MKKEYKVIEHTTSIDIAKRYPGYRVGVKNIKWHNGKDGNYWEGDIVMLECRDIDKNAEEQIAIAFADGDIDYHEYLPRPEDDPEGWA